MFGLSGKKDCSTCCLLVNTLRKSYACLYLCMLLVLFSFVAMLWLIAACRNVYDNFVVCGLRGGQFVLYGSIMAFYVPLIIMFATYALSVRILQRNHQLMKMIALGSVRHKGPKTSSNVAAAAAAAASATSDAAGKMDVASYYLQYRHTTQNS